MLGHIKKEQNSITATTQSSQSAQSVNVIIIDGKLLLSITRIMHPNGTIQECTR